VTSDKDGRDSAFERRLPEADVVISQPFWPAYLTAERIAMAPKLKLALTAGIGSDHVDLDAAARAHITVAEVTGSNSISVAEHVVMTTLALVAGMLPLWVGTGPGSEERRAIAVVVIGGQTLCLLLTLLVTPVAYSLFEDLAQALRWSAPSLAPWRRLAKQDERRDWRRRIRRRWLRPPARELPGGTGDD